jgi:uncharacterized damage-inducible protein DinB
MTHYDLETLEGYHPEIGLLLGCLKDSTREWQEHLGEVSIEAMVWQPAPASYSIGGLILHLIDCEDAWFRWFLAGNARDPEEVALFLSKETRQDLGEWPTPPAKPLSWYLELHSRIRMRAFEGLKGMEPDRVYERAAFGYTCTARWVVGHVLEHDSYTGGQAVALHELYKKMKRE